MPVLIQLDKPNVWKSICAEFEAKNNPVEVTKQKIREDEIIGFDPLKHSTVFFGHSYTKVNPDDPRFFNNFDPTKSHPACLGFSIKKYTPSIELPQTSRSLPDKTKCSERVYIESYVFPTLLTAMELMLNAAKQSKCFERKRTAFNACDFLTEYLYKNNPFKSKETKEARNKVKFWDIPFVKEFNDLNPRPPLPKSLIWTESEGALIIQSYYRGYLVRRDPEVQELRQWQREYREENRNIVDRVEQFWQQSNPEEH